MSRTRNRPSQPSRSSLILIAGSLCGAACASKVELGQTNADGSHPTSFQKLSHNSTTAIDLLLMIDNSSSMADKQVTLATAVPQLLGQLVQPNCVDASGNPTGAVVQLGAPTPCTSGTPEFNPVNNIHIGIVTSSLGDHGATDAQGNPGTICTPGKATSYVDPLNQTIVQPPDVNDMSHLVGTLARASAARGDAQSTYATLNTLGFLEWGDKSLPNPGAADLTAASLIFTDLVKSTKEVGCGYEASLEGWFRFLIDPVPPTLPLAAPVANATKRSGSDDTLLNQRAAFLRPDSLVAIVMLTDENDCSIRDTDVGWVSAKTDQSITRGSDQCKANPNDRCCYSCTASAPSGCTASCTPPAGNDRNVAVDDGSYQASLRCWQQKRRFGYEFLYPKSRYVVGLTKPELCPDQSYGDMDCDCTYATKIGASCNPGSRRMPNPLYSTIIGTLNNGQQISAYPDSVARSDNSQVYIAGIVGVPWQDIGRLNGGVLQYIPVTDPAWTSPGAGIQPDNTAAGTNSIWDLIYGDDNANITPKDIHMVESVEPRPGLPPPTAAANADPYNGHEYNTARGDLQYACIYQLPAAKPCQCTATDATYASCKYLHPNDCCDQTFQSDASGNPNSGGNYSKPICNATTQVAAKAYPGLREIAVLRDYALSPAASQQGNSIVASICPQDLTSFNTSPGYGYNPAVAALIGRIKEPLKGSCFPKPLDIKSDGSVPCVMIEAVPPSKVLPQGTACAAFCTTNQRKVASAAMVSDVTAAMQNGHVCDSGSLTCASMCICQLPQEAGNELTTCQTDTTGADVSLPPGFCYVDPDRGAGNPDLVGKCPETQRRNLRFVGNNPTGGGTAVPLAGAFAYLSCNSSYN